MKKRYIIRKESKGYTLLEILVAATLGAIIVIIGLMWAGGIGRIAINAAASSDIGQVEVAFNRLTSDLINSTHCNPSGKDAKIRHIEKNKIGIVTKNLDTSSVGVAWWRLSDNQLQRGWTELDPNTCESSEPLGWSTLATNIGSESSGFYPVYSGESLTDYSPLTCLLKFEEGCDLPGVSTYLYSSISRQGFEETILLNSPTAGSSGLIYEENIDFTTVQRPGEVTNVTVQVFDTALRLSWDAPSANLGTIEDYYIQYKESSSNSWALYRDGLSSATSAVVKNLTNGSEYDFKVAAVNEKGTGLYSEQVSGTPVLFAEGGSTTVVESDGQAYRVHTYTTVGSSSFTANLPLEVEYVVVAGGGGGGTSGGVSGAGGGGGAGGFISGTANLNQGTSNITVGSGGVGGVHSSYGTATLSSNGGNSSLGNIEAIGGGAGGYRASGIVPLAGGSGGGAGGTGSYILGAAGTEGQGYAGGDGTNVGNTTGQRAGGGGGGASEEGGDAVFSIAGSGGDGVLVSIRGYNEYFAGGGGGGVHIGGISIGEGGIGGGGAGGFGQAGQNGTPNTGGGGGGGAGAGAGVSVKPGGNGGSGIVIIRYRIY